MEYTAIIHFLDGQTININASEAKLQELISCVRSDEPFWNEAKDNAFYVPMKNIRFVQMFKKKEHDEKAESAAD